MENCGKHIWEDEKTGIGGIAWVRQENIYGIRERRMVMFRRSYNFRSLRIRVIPSTRLEKSHNVVKTELVILNLVSA